MSVWWCIVHDTQAPFLADKQAGPGDCWAVASGERFSRCDIRPALVIVRDADGNWPEWAIKKLRKLVGGHFQRDHRHPVNCDCRGEASILDALAEAAKENPPWLEGTKRLRSTC